MLGLGSSFLRPGKNPNQSDANQCKFPRQLYSCQNILLDIQTPVPRTPLSRFEIYGTSRPVGVHRQTSCPPVNRHLITVITGQAGTGGPESLLSTGDTQIEVCILSLHAHSQMKKITDKALHYISMLTCKATHRMRHTCSHMLSHPHTHTLFFFNVLLSILHSPHASYLIENAYVCFVLLRAKKMFNKMHTFLTNLNASHTQIALLQTFYTIKG